MSAAKWIKSANKKLSGHGVQLELIGVNDNIYMRGMFPPRPKKGSPLSLSKQGEKTQQRVALKIRALTVQDVDRACDVALEVARDLRAGMFNWEDFLGLKKEEESPLLIKNLIAQLEEEKKHKLQAESWRYNYWLKLQTLPMDQVITEDLMYLWILEQDPERTTARRYYVTIAKALLEIADLPSKKIQRLGGTANKPKKPRILPEDEEIEKMWSKLYTQKGEEWAAVYGMLATYGLRPHELFRLDLSGFPEVRVSEETKTGLRIVIPLYEHWVEKFQLSKDFKLPSRLIWEPNQSNTRLGRKIGNAFSKMGCGEPYDLRHAYSRRGLQLGISSEVLAKLLGHSRQTNEETYKSYIKDSVYIDLAREMVLNAARN